MKRVSVFRSAWMIFLGLFIMIAACSAEAPLEAERTVPVPVVAVPAVPVQENGNREEASLALLFEQTRLPTFSYDSVGRRDPFRSVIARSENRSKAVKSLPPLQRNQLSDLSLQGIILGGDGPIAMINTPDGKGYTVRVGTRVGFNHGVISRITQKKIVVEETLLNVFGEPKKRNVVMKLHPQKEGS